MTIVECISCRRDFDADLGVRCVWCGAWDPDAARVQKDIIRRKLVDICQMAADGGLTTLDMEHLILDAWPSQRHGEDT